MRKHGVAFREAQTLCFADDAILYDDPDHSEDEERFLLVGVSAAPRGLFVVHCARGEQSDGEAIRIISPRGATNREQAAG